MKMIANSPKSKTKREKELEEEVEILTTALAVYREEKKRIPFFTRVWRKIFGRRVFIGNKVCKKCKFWLAPQLKAEKVRVTQKIKKFGLTWPRHTELWYEPPGLCGISPSGEEETKPEDHCESFQPQRKYTVRVWG